MDNEYTYLLHLLGAYLREESPAPAENVDWGKLLELARVHSVVGIVGYMGRKYDICPDYRYADDFRRLCMGTISIYSQRHTMALEMVRQLEQAGIDHILMKGFVIREYYPIPELRTFTDIDIVIRPEDRIKCHSLMQTLGYKSKEDWEPVYSYYRGDEYYEIHTQIMEIDVSDKADYRGYFTNTWENVCMVSPHGYRFAPEFHFLYMLTHIAKHIQGTGAGVRMYMDVAAFIRHHSKNMDWVWVEKELRKLSLFDFSRVVLSEVEQWFGVNKPFAFQPVSEEVLDNFARFTVEAGTFGRYGRDGALAKMKHQEKTDSNSRASLLLQQIFPDAETIQARYTYLRDKPWLLPVAWVHRWIKTSGETRNHLNLARQIVQADMEEVDRLRKLIKDIGL